MASAFQVDIPFKSYVGGVQTANNQKNKLKSIIKAVLLLMLAVFV